MGSIGLAYVCSKTLFYTEKEHLESGICKDGGLFCRILSDVRVSWVCK